MGKLPLKGIRIADFTWVAAGPATTRIFAILGAEVIKIESNRRIDLSRGRPPFAPGKTGINAGMSFNNVSAQKLSITLNMGHPKGRELAKRLISISDIVADNFTSGVMDRWGLGYEELVKIKPDIITFSMPVMGKGGPYDEFGGYGMGIEATAGLKQIWGDPDLPPVGSGIAYPDAGPNPRHAAVAVMAALHYRNKTGKGQHIEIAQLESTACYTGTAILDYSVNGRIQGRRGTRLPGVAPNGCYRCNGDDRWCVISVYTDEEWTAFCNVLDNPEWSKEAKFDTIEGRKANEDELNELVEKWTVERTPEEIMLLMQKAGVCSGVVANGQDLVDGDPQLRARNHYLVLDHAEAEKVTCDNLSFRLSASPGELTHAAPLLGEHNDYVYRDLLGISEEEMNECYVEGVFD